MKPTRQFSDYFRDMHDAITKAQLFVAGMNYAQFEADEKTAFAVVRALEIIGEAASKIPPHERSNHPHLPWNEMTSMRNVLIHDYFGVNWRVVWNTVERDLPPLHQQLREILKIPHGGPSAALDP